MIGTLIIIIPLLIGIGCFWYGKSNYYYSGFESFGVVMLVLSGIIILTAGSVYINTSTYQAERNSIQQSLDRARESGSEYELATIQREVIEFNRRLDLDAKFWHQHFKLWINDDILELEPVQ